MIARNYERLPVQDRLDFWNTIGPSQYISRLDYPETQDRALVDSEIQVVQQRLSNGRLDAARSRQESIYTGVNNMTQSKEFHSALEEQRLYERLKLYGISEEAIMALNDKNFLKKYMARVQIGIKMLPIMILTSMIQATKDEMREGKGNH